MYRELLVSPYAWAIIAVALLSIGATMSIMEWRNEHEKNTKISIVRK